MIRHVEEGPVRAEVDVGVGVLHDVGEAHDMCFSADSLRSTMATLGTRFCHDGAAADLERVTLGGAD
eukprot:4841782-Pyramimonas_sp.AAC.1